MGFAPNVEQVSGLAWMTGYPDMPLVPRGVCDPIGGMHASFALLLALEQRRRSGRGQRVEAPLVEPALNLAAESVIEWSAYGACSSAAATAGPRPRPRASTAAGRPPASATASGSPWRWPTTATGAGCGARSGIRRRCAPPRSTPKKVGARRTTPSTPRSRTGAQGAAPPRPRRRCCARGVPASQLVNAHFLMPNPQLEDRAFFQTLAHPVSGTLRYPGLPMRFSAWGPQLHRSASPTLGQHNDEILRELGLSSGEIQALRDAKAIGERPAFA